MGVLERLWHRVFPLPTMDELYEEAIADAMRERFNAAKAAEQWAAAEAMYARRVERLERERRRLNAPGAAC